MFIILSFIVGTYDNLHIIGEDGEPSFFDTKKQAEVYAEENCAWNYKIVNVAL